MSLSTPFIHRPVGTTLLTVAIALAGILSYFFLPVSPFRASFVDKKRTHRSS